jgi:uncharacterized protein YfeS
LFGIALGNRSFVYLKSLKELFRKKKKTSFLSLPKNAIMKVLEEKRGTK